MNFPSISPTLLRRIRFQSCQALFFPRLLRYFSTPGRAEDRKRRIKRKTKEGEREKERGELSFLEFLHRDTLSGYVALLLSSSSPSSIEYLPSPCSLLVIIETRILRIWRLQASVRSNEKFIAASFRSDFLRWSLTRREKRSCLPVLSLSLSHDFSPW